MFVDGRGCIVQAPHVVLNGKFIYNLRRSQQMSETFVFGQCLSGLETINVNAHPFL